jgi:hypothetical protein
MQDTSLIMLGWREWVALPKLLIPKIKAKIDTGAKTSALHAFSIETYVKNNQDKVRFAIHPQQRNTTQEIICTADILDVRNFTDSGGHTEQRIVIKTPIQIGDLCWPIEITLTNRDTMAFRMLIGRSALDNKFYVNPAKSYLTGKKKKFYENSYPL